ncbi:MAG: hypothetical protein ACPGLV_02430 [Bacteroidia bacterium]
MLLSVNGINEQLENYISENYNFRKNLLNKILGKELLEYKRAESISWNPVSKFISKERRKIISSQGVENVNDQDQYPNWLLEKIALNYSTLSHEYIENRDYLKIIDELPTTVTGVKPLRTAKRQSVHLQEGDKCYISFGVRKKLFRKFSRALPAVVESVRTQGGTEYYNVLVLKLNKKTKMVEYFGRHLIMNTEVGKTPEEAVKNIAYSQAIY